MLDAIAASDKDRDCDDEADPSYRMPDNIEEFLTEKRDYSSFNDLDGYDGEGYTRPVEQTEQGRNKMALYVSRILGVGERQVFVTVWRAWGLWTISGHISTLLPHVL